MQNKNKLPNFIMLSLMVFSGMSFAFVRPVSAVTPRINEQNNIVDNFDKTFSGSSSLDYAGQNVELIGDVNDDGYADYAISAPNNEDNGCASNCSGKTYIFFGGASGWSGSASVDSADASYVGEGNSDESGYRVTRLGDVNGDTIDDFAISAVENDYSGTTGGTTPSVNVTASADTTLTDNTSFNFDANGSSFMLVQASYRNLDSDPYTDSITSMDYNGTGLTPVCRATNFGYSTELWYLVNPDVGTNAVSAYWSNVVDDIVLTATSFDSVDTSTPISNYTCNDNGGVWDATPAVTVSSNSYNLVYAGASTYVGGFNSLSLDSGTEIFNISGVGNVISVGATQAGSASVTVSWTGIVEWPWSTAAVDLHANGGMGYGGTNAGQVYIIFGKTSGWTTDASLGTADGSFVGRGGGRLGTEIANIGDVNDDGFNDIIMGAYLTLGLSQGEAYVYYGHSGAWAMYEDVLTVADVTYSGDPGSGTAESLSRGMSGLGDVNGDSIDDFAISAPGYDGAGGDKGRLSIYFGSGSGPVLGATYIGADSDRVATDVAGIGDINDDGKNDILFGDETNTSYLVFGKSSGWGMDQSPSTAPVTFTTSALDYAGLGDINQDGIDDFAINTGDLYIFFGKTSGWGTNIDVTTADTYFYSVSNPVYGRGIAGGLDLNADGYMDFIVGKDYENSSFGAAYIGLGGPNKHSVINLDAGLDVEVLGGNNIESGSGQYAANEAVRLKKGSLYVAQVTANLRASDRDWTGVTADVNLGTFKSVITGLSAVPGNAGTHSLFVPKSPSHDAVHICPSAAVLADVTTACAGGYDLTTSDPSVSLVTIGGQNYWKVDGLTGTGGVGTALTYGDIGLTLTPNAMSTSTTTEIVVHWTPSANIGIGGTAAIDFHTPITIANTCASPTTDADGDTVTDGSATITSVPSGPRYLYTFSAATTAAATTGLTFCVNVTSPSTAGNYIVDAYDSAGGFASTFLYVGNENQVNIIAHVDNVLTFSIRNTADTADLANVGNLAYGPNLCDLGNLSIAGVQTCSYRLKVATNAQNGYTVNIQTDGSLRNSTNTKFISNITTGTSVTSGIEGYGMLLSAGSATGGTITPQGGFATPDTALATAITTGINTSLYTCSSTNNPSTTDTVNTALVTHRAESDAGTSAGTYTQLVTYTVSASF